MYGDQNEVTLQSFCGDLESNDDYEFGIGCWTGFNGTPVLTCVISLAVEISLHGLKLTPFSWTWTQTCAQIEQIEAQQI